MAEVKVRRHKKGQVQETDGSMPLKCKKCDANLTDVILGDPPACPYCHAAIKLRNPPAAPVNPNEPKPESSTEKPTSKTMTIGTETHEATGTFQATGIKARVIIPEVSKIEINKVSAEKGKLETKVTFTVGNINEISLLRIVHMMGQNVKVGVNIVAEKLQTDFLDIVDPATQQTMLAQISRKDLEDRGYLTATPTDAQVKAAVKAVEDKKRKSVSQTTFTCFEKTSARLQDVEGVSVYDVSEIVGERQLLGVTPLVVDLFIGVKYTLRFIKEGYVDAVEKIKPSVPSVTRSVEMVKVLPIEEKTAEMDKAAATT